MPGDLADLVVVDRDPLAVDETALRGPGCRPRSWKGVSPMS
jgi:predicted amidohydrolase YtcJ